MIGSRASAVPPNSPPRCALAPRPAAGNPTCEPLGAAMCTIPVSSGDLAWRRGLDARVPGWHCGLVPGGAAHLYAPSSQAAPPPPPRSGPAGRGGSEAGLSSPARRGAASLLRRRSLLPPPPPSRSLVLAGAAQTCSGAAAPARIGLGLRPRDPATGALPARLGPSALTGKGLPWSPGSGICGGAAGGSQPEAVFRAVRSAAGSPLPTPFSRALPFPSTLSPPAFFFPFASPLMSLLPFFSLPI